MRTPEEVEARFRLAEQEGQPRELGLRFTDWDRDAGRVRAEFHPEARHRNLGGGVHGGVLATLADIVAGAGVICSMGPEDWTATTELNISYLRRFKTAPVRAEARALHRGLRTQVWEVEISDGGGRRMAMARLQFLCNQGARV